MLANVPRSLEKLGHGNYLGSHQKVLKRYLANTHTQSRLFLFLLSLMLQCDQARARVTAKKEKAEEAVKKEAEIARENAVSVEEKKRRAEGTPVTVENFNAWNAKFLKEREEEEEREKCNKEERAAEAEEGGRLR